MCGRYLLLSCLSTKATHSASPLNFWSLNCAQPPFAQSSLVAGGAAVAGVALGALSGLGRVVESLPVAPLLGAPAPAVGLLSWANAGTTAMVRTRRVVR